MTIKGYYFNESGIDFDQAMSNLLDGKSVQIQAPNSISLKNFEKIVVYLNFTEGAYSDYTQFKLLQNAIDNHPEAPLWTKNDSIYVDYEYNDIDYFLLMEDYAVGSDDSLFEHLDYVRNGNFVTYDTLGSEYIFNKNTQMADFDNFTRHDDKRTVLEFCDSNLDGQHELVIQKDDINVDGVYDVFKYGQVDTSGEIAFHTTLIKVESTNVETQKNGETRKSKVYTTGSRWRKIKDGRMQDSDSPVLAQRIIMTNTTTISQTTKTTVVVQKDLDLDGIIDKDVTFEATNVFSSSTMFTTETTNFFEIVPTIIGTIVEYRNSTIVASDKSHTFIFRDYEDGEVNSTRIYDDVFPNELSEKYNLNNYLETVYNDGNDEDPSNDLVLQAPAMGSLLSFKHTTDDVPAIFDRRITINSPAVIDNILDTSVTISIPDSRTGLDKTTATLDVIEVIPEDGKVIIDGNPRTSPNKVQIDGGRYLHYSSAQNGVYDQVFVLDEDNNVLAVSMDYDYNFRVEPNKKVFTEKHIMSTEVVEGDVEYLMADSRVYLRDFDRYDGFSLDPTFADSFYDIWKIAYTSSTSQLIKEVKAITSSQFVQSVQTRIVGDVVWQVASQMIAFAVSSLLHAIPGIGTVLSGLAYALVYGLLNAAKSWQETIANENIIASQTLNNENYEGEITLSSKGAYSDLWGGTLPNIVGFSTAGVYTDIRLEVDKHIFKGNMLLAPKGVHKTDFLGMRNIPISLDYTKQKGGYIIYSDFNDPRLAPYIDPTPPAPGLLLGTAGIISYAQQVEAYKASLDTDVIYMANTMIFLENAISKQTNGEYYTVYPYMMSREGTFVPTYQFSGFNSKYPTPEYYHDYPVFVDEEHYSQFENEYSIIYKIFDIESTKEIQLIPDDGVHAIYSDVAEIDVIFRDTQGLNIPLGPFKASAGLFTYNEFTGILTMGDVLYNDLHGQLTALFNSYSGVQDYDAYIVLQVNIAKYRSMSDLQGMTQEEVNHIATMRAIEQSILEYTYQFKHAQATQQGLSEMFYTVLITTISTVITTIATLGIGAIAGKLNTATSKALTAESKVSGEAYKNAVKALSYTESLINNLASSITSASFLSVILSPITESLQEIFVDPFLETIVADIVAKSGGNIFWQVLASSLVEGGREALTGSMSQFLFSGNTQQDSQGMVETVHKARIVQSDQNAVETSLENKKYSLKVTPKLSSIIKSGASLILGAALIGIGGPMFFGATLATGFVALQSISQDVKILKIITHNIVSEQLPSDYYLNDVIADSTTALINEGIKDALKWAQSSSPAKDSVPNLPQEMIDNSMKLRIGLPIGMTSPINVYSGKPLYFMTQDGDPNRIVDLQNRRQTSPEEVLIKEIADVFLEKLLITVPATRLRVELRARGIRGYAARGITQEGLTDLVLTNLPRELLVQEIFGWSTSESRWNIFRRSAQIFIELSQGFYTFGDKIFSKKFNNEGDYTGGILRADTIEQLIDLVENLQDDTLHQNDKKKLLDGFNQYLQSRGLRNFQQVLNKPEWVLTKSLQKIFSTKLGRRISMDELSRMIFGEDYKSYFRDHFSGTTRNREFKPSNVKIIETYSEQHLGTAELATIKTLIDTWRVLRNDVAYGAPTNSPKQQDINLINSLRDILTPLFNDRPPNNLELGKFFGKKNLFADVSNLGIYRKFKVKDIDFLVDVIRDKLIPKSVSGSWDKATIAKNALKDLGNFRAKFYLKEESRMLTRQVTGLYDQYGYPVGWKGSKMRKLQTEILWLQQRGRCAISGEEIVLGRDKVARHHIEFINSKSTIKDLVLVKDKYHGEIKKHSVKQGWINNLLLAKRNFEKGRPAEHWDKKDRIDFSKLSYGRILDSGILKLVSLWRADLRHYV